MNRAMSTGLALRFPRFIRSRPDKTQVDASTSEDVVRIFRAQARQ